MADDLVQHIGNGRRVGLVLAGGGARGAYQAGVVDRLAHHGIQVDAVAGASIGALNGAIVAASPDLTSAGQRLCSVWMRIANLASTSPGSAIDHPVGISRIVELLASPVLRPGFVSKILRDEVGEDELIDGLPFWISIFPPGPLEESGVPGGWLLDVAKARLSGGAPEWLRVDSLNGPAMYDAVVASAALPLVLPARQIGNRNLRDGGIVDNVPTAPLVMYEQCDLVFVVNLSPGTAWDASIVGEASVVEIRPSESLDGTGGLSGVESLLDFSSTRVDSLVKLGRKDVDLTVARLRQVFGSMGSIRSSTERMADALDQLDKLQ